MLFVLFVVCVCFVFMHVAVRHFIIIIIIISNFNIGDCLVCMYLQQQFEPRPQH